MDPRTKICCTVGPATEDVAVLQGLVEAGADVFRVNGALVTDEQVGQWVERVRSAASRAGREVGVLLDLPGPKLRVGEVEGDRFEIRPGQTLRLDAEPEPSRGDRIPVRSLQTIGAVRAGDMVQLGDGRERLLVKRVEPDALSLEVLEGGEVRTGMGVHLSGVSVPAAVPTGRDRDLLRVGVAAGVDMIAQSFVRTAEDMSRLKEALVTAGGRSLLAVAKIERREALDALDRIVERADALIVARGDLAIDVGVENVPSAQRRVLDAARRGAKPAVVATEMLDSMTHRLRPTRAEASDVAGAVFQGADAVMLSGETAVGEHPVLVVETMARILAAAEADPSAPYAGRGSLPAPTRWPGRPDQHVVRAAVDLAREAGAAAIVVFTRTGSSAVRLSKERPAARIHAFAPSADVVRRLALAWGVRTVLLDGARHTDVIVQHVVEHLRESGALQAGERAVAVMGGARDPAGATSLIQLVHC